MVGLIGVFLTLRKAGNGIVDSGRLFKRLLLLIWMPLEWAWGRLYVNRGSSGRLTIVFAEDMMACRIATEAMKDEHELKVIRTRRRVGAVRIRSSSSQPIVFIGRGHLA